MYLSARNEITTPCNAATSAHTPIIHEGNTGQRQASPFTHISLVNADFPGLRVYKKPVYITRAARARRYFALIILDDIGDGCARGRKEAAPSLRRAQSYTPRDFTIPRRAFIIVKNGRGNKKKCTQGSAPMEFAFFEPTEDACRACGKGGSRVL